MQREAQAPLRPKVRLPGRPAPKVVRKKKAFKHLYELAQDKDFDTMETEFAKIDDPSDSAYGILIRAYIHADIETSSSTNVARVNELFEQQIAMMVPHMRIYLLMMKLYADLDHSKEFTEILTLVKAAVVSHLGKALPDQWDDFFRRAARCTDRGASSNQLIEFMNLWVTTCATVSNTTALVSWHRDVPLYFATQTTNVEESSASLAGIPLQTICPSPEAVARARNLVYHHIGRDSMASDADRIARFASTRDFNIVVDAMNIGCAGKGTFNPKYLTQALTKLLKMGMKPLVMLPKTVSYTAAPRGCLLYKCRTKKSKKIVDDHFWLLACMTRQSFYLSNDLLRDHQQFWDAMMDARSFAERCQVRWSRVDGSFQFQFPLPWTRSSQQLDETHWAFPIQGSYSNWLLVTTEASAAEHIPTSPV